MYAVPCQHQSRHHVCGPLPQRRCGRVQHVCHRGGVSQSTENHGWVPTPRMPSVADLSRAVKSRSVERSKDLTEGPVIDPPKHRCAQPCPVTGGLCILRLDGALVASISVPMWNASSWVRELRLGWARLGWAGLGWAATRLDRSWDRLSRVAIGQQVGWAIHRAE